MENNYKLKLFAIFISIFGTLVCSTFGIMKIVNYEISGLLHIFLGAINATCFIVNLITYIKGELKN